MAICYHLSSVDWSLGEQGRNTVRTPDRNLRPGIYIHTSKTILFTVHTGIPSTYISRTGIRYSSYFRWKLMTGDLYVRTRRTRFAEKWKFSLAALFPPLFLAGLNRSMQTDLAKGRRCCGQRYDQWPLSFIVVFSSPCFYRCLC